MDTKTSPILSEYLIQAHMNYCVFFSTFAHQSRNVLYKFLKHLFSKKYLIDHHTETGEENGFYILMALQ